MTDKEAIEVLKQTGGVINPLVHPVGKHTASQVYEAVNLAIKALGKTPTGKWEFTTHHARRYRVCPYCKSEKEDDRAGGWYFCWHCGTKMGGEEE